MWANYNLSWQGFNCGYAYTYGEYNLYTPIKNVNTGIKPLDYVLGVGASTLNLIGGGINVISNGVGSSYQLANMASEAVIGMDLDEATNTLMANGMLAPAGATLKGFNMYMDSLKVGSTSKAVNITLGAAKTTINAGASLVGIEATPLNTFNNLPSNQGYSSFGKLKKAIGSAGEGKHWHHIVEQSQIKKSGFSSELINNTNNIIAIDHETHMKITGYYKRIYGDTGMSLRDYLAGQSYDTQYKVGMDVLKMFSVIE